MFFVGIYDIFYLKQNNYPTYAVILWGFISSLFWSLIIKENHWNRDHKSKKSSISKFILTKGIKFVLNLFSPKKKVLAILAVLTALMTMLMLYPSTYQLLIKESIFLSTIFMFTWASLLFYIIFSLFYVKQFVSFIEFLEKK